MTREATFKAALALAFLLAPTAAVADTLSWSIPVGGTYSYAGGLAPLVGSGIGVQSVLDVTTNTQFPIVGGLVSFTSGAQQGAPWNWGPGSPGSLNVAGCIAGVAFANGDSTCANPADTVTLLSDEFLTAQVVPVSGNLKVTLGSITGSINSGLASSFGVSTAISNAIYNTTTSINGNPGSPFANAPNLSGSITTDPAPVQAIPEPSTLLLLGTGLAGLAGRRTRKTRAKQR